MNATLNYYMSPMHWIDATSEHDTPIASLSAAVQHLLKSQVA